MYTQKNNLKVFVSKLSVPYTVVGKTITEFMALTGKDTAVAFFGTDNKTADSAIPGYFGYVKEGIFYKTAVTDTFKGWTADAPTGYRAATGKKVEITIPSSPAGSYFQLVVTIKGEGNVDVMLDGVYKSKASDTATNIAAAITASLNGALSRMGGIPKVTVTSSAAKITITALQNGYKAGGLSLKKFWDFDAAVKHIECTTVETPGIIGIGEGWWVAEKEWFAKGNSDSLSLNDRRTALPSNLIADPDAEYDVLAHSFKVMETDNAHTVIPLTQQVVIAFDSNGGTFA